MRLAPENGFNPLYYTILYLYSIPKYYTDLKSGHNYHGGHNYHFFGSLATNSVEVCYKTDSEELYLRCAFCGWDMKLRRIG